MRAGRRTVRPVVSLLDVDFYKFTMGYFAYRRHPDVNVRYRLIWRSGGAAAPASESALRDALDAVRDLSFRPAELRFLAGLPLQTPFPADYIDFLRRLRLPPYRLETRGTQVAVEVEGRWPAAIFWETLILSVVSELHCRAALGGGDPDAAARAVGEERLDAKIAGLRRAPGVRFASFGTRRRFSRRWQYELEARLARELPGQFLGTSCVESARQNGLTPIGTIAHEIFMVGAVLFGDSEAAIRGSMNRMLDDWWALFGEPGSLMLADTWTSSFYFREVGTDRARRFAGIRQDSGSPAGIAERALDWYRSLGIDPASKKIVFSDGLEADDLVALEARFGERIQVSFGWGTNLTNDCGVPAASVVMKPVAANGRPVVKLSDDPAKSTGDPNEVARYRRVFEPSRGGTVHGAVPEEGPDPTGKAPA